LSRKRKLSELYFATVSLVDPEAAPKEPSYLEEEQAFLNANDLAKYVAFVLLQSKRLRQSFVGIK